MVLEIEETRGLTLPGVRFRFGLASARSGELQSTVRRITWRSRILMLLAALGTAAACRTRAAATAPAPPRVSVVTVHRQPVPVLIELPGRTTAYLTAQVRARVDGIVLTRAFREGSDVRAGQQLYQIDPAPYIAALNSAKAGLQKAQANLVAAAALAERYKTLVGSNAISQQDYDNAVAARGQAEADVATGRAALETAQINLGYTSVVSPISGRSGLSLVTQGAYVQASAATLMTSVEQIDPIYVDLSQSSVIGLRLRREVAGGRLKLVGPEHARVTLILEDSREYPQAGSLEANDVNVDQGTGSVTIRAVVPNPAAVLLPGMFVRARIEGDFSGNAFLVPQDAVGHDPKGQATALVVGPDGKAALRILDVVAARGDRWIVEGGLKEGDRLIVAGLRGVRPGSVVQAIEAKPDAPASSAPNASDGQSLRSTSEVVSAAVSRPS